MVAEPGSPRPAAPRAGAGGSGGAGAGRGGEEGPPAGCGLGGGRPWAPPALGWARTGPVKHVLEERGAAGGAGTRSHASVGCRNA